MHSDVHDYDVYDSADEEIYEYDPQDYEEYEAEDYHDEEYYDDTVTVHADGGQRVLRLGLILMLLLLITAVIIFGVIPYVEAMTNTAPALLPPVQA